MRREKIKKNDFPLWEIFLLRLWIRQWIPIYYIVVPLTMGVIWGGEGGRQGDTSPHVLKGGRHNIKCPPPHVFWTCVCVPPKVLYPYKFRLERGLKLCTFSSPNTKFFLGKGFCPLTIPKILYTYNFWQKMDVNFAFWVSSNTRSLMKRRAAPLRPPKIIYFCKFRGLKLCIFSLQNTKFP